MQQQDIRARHHRPETVAGGAFRRLREGDVDERLTRLLIKLERLGLIEVRN